MNRFLVLIIAVLVVVAGWSGAWFYAAGEARNAIATLAAPAGEDGTAVTCGELDITGFPFRFDLDCRQAAITSGDVVTTLAGLRASALAYNPTQVKLSALSPVTLSDAFSGAQSRIDFASAEGSARIMTDDLMQGLGGDGWRIGRVSIVVNDIDWVDTVVGETPVLSAQHLEAHLVDMPELHDPASGTAALAAYATLDEAAAPTVGIDGGKLTFEAEITGLPDDLRELAAGEAVARWQEAGGQLKLVSFKGTAGEEFVESSGAVGLDSGARLDGQVTLRHRGLAERLGTLIPEDWKGLILGGQDADGSYSQTLTIKAGIVFSGLVPVSIIPPLL